MYFSTVDFFFFSFVVVDVAVARLIGSIRIISPKPKKNEIISKLDYTRKESKRGNKKEHEEKVKTNELIWKRKRTWHRQNQRAPIFGCEIEFFFSLLRHSIQLNQISYLVDRDACMQARERNSAQRRSLQMQEVLRERQRRCQNEMTRYESAKTAFVLRFLVAVGI